MPAELSIIIPCYNEEENIKECIKKIPQLPWLTEIIVVNDGSKDNTAKIARSIRDTRLKVVSYSFNRRKGYACRKGFEKALGKVVVICDADMATHPEEIRDVVKPIFDNDADFVNGSRMVLPMEKRAMKWLHKPGNRAFALIMSVIIGKWLTDTLCGFKAFRKDKLSWKLLKQDSWPDFELLLQAKQDNLRIKEVPIHYRKRIKGNSKMKTFHHGYKMFAELSESILKK